MVGGGLREKIIRLLSKHDYGLTIEDVARSLEINRMTASKYLAILEATRQIAVREVGKAKLHYPKTKGNHKWMKLNNYKSSCGLNGIGFLFLLLLFFTAIIFFSTITTANPNGGNQNFEIFVIKDYTEKLIILEIKGPPLTDFSLTLINPENKSISPKGNVYFRTDQEGGYELQLIGFVPGDYLIILESNGTGYTEDFVIEDFVESECNRTFLEYRAENITNETETNESVAGEYVWDICRDFVELNVTKEELISEMAENRSFVESENVTNETIERTFVEEELSITEITDNRTFVENETMVNETLERSFVEEELNITEIAENMTFVERELNVTNITETNESIPRLFIEKVVEFLPEKKKFGMNEKPKFKFVSKNIFSEQGKVIEEFAEPEVLNVSVYGPDQKLLGIKTDILKMGGGEYEIEISKGRAFRPGLYRIRMDFSEGLETYGMEDEFLWGVLAINTHKSIYLENEEAFIGIAVLDNEGRMVCDADVTLEIADPNGTATTLATSDGTISVSPECEFYGVTNLPDYYAYYTVNTEGTYIMTLTALTRNGERTMTDTFLVQKQVDFDVERNGPTRIYPPAKYQMVFTIKANKDFDSGIREYVPSSFEITPQQGLTITTTGDAKTLTWNEKLTAGETHQISYEFDAPDVSPYLFTLGALEIGDWKEAREWMIASDAPTIDTKDPTSCTSTWTNCEYAYNDDSNYADSGNNDGSQETWSGYGFSLSEPIQVNSVKVKIKSLVGNTAHDINLEVYNGSDWGTPHALTDQSSCTEEIVDVTSDFSWNASQINSIQVRATATIGGGPPGDKWVGVCYVPVEVNYTLLNDPPSWTTDLDDTPDSLYAGNQINYTATADDPEGDNYRLTVCDTNEINDGYPGTCVGNELCNSSATADDAQASCNYTTTINDVGTLNAYGFVCDEGSSICNSTYTSESTTVKHTINISQEQADPQKARNNTAVNISANVSYYGSGSLDSVIARIYYPNGSSAENYTMVSGGGSIYWNNSYVVYFTPAGTYNVTIFANDTNGVSNTETTWFAPYLNLSKEENITINGSFEDWSGVTVVTDNGTDASGGAGVVDNELLITGLNDDGGNISIFAFNQSGTEEYDLNWSADTGSDGPSQVSGGKIGDVTNDGNNDFLIPSSDGSNYYLEVWTYNSSSQEWYNVWTSAAISSSYRPWIGAIGDFDDDTFTEFLITKQNSDIEIWGNDSYNATGFSLNTTLKSGCSTGNYPEGAGDLNDNDIPELVVQCITTDPFEIYEWNTTDYELQDSVSRDGLFADEIECGDLDRDTIDECVICGGNGNTTVIDYSGGSYSKVYWNDAPDATPSCGIGDFTNDGWPDFFDVNQVDGVRVFSYNGTDYVNIWNGTGGFGGDPLIAASDGGDADNDGRDEIIHPTEEAGDTIMLWENNSDSEAESFNNTLNWTGIGNIVNIIIGDLDSDAIGLEGGSNEDFDITNMSLANNDTYLFARIAVNGSIDVSEGDKYYRVFISTDDSVGNETSPENEDLPFKYDFRVQVNGSSCYVFNYTDYSINVSSCLFNYTGGQMEIAVNLTVLGLSTNDNANITFQTGSTNPGGYDSAPDGESFLSYDVPGGPPAISITAEGSFTGSATINENESTNYTGNCTCSGGSCDDVYIRIQDNSTGGWSDSSTTGDNVFVNVTSYSIPSPLSGTSDNYYFNVTGNSSGHYNFRVVCNTTSATEDPSDASLLVVSACNVDFTMTSQLQTGILFSEQDPNVVNVSAADNGDYNVTDNSNSACGTVNVSVRATSDLVNGSSTIGIDNVTVNSTSPGSQTIQLSTSYQLIRSGMPAGTSNITTLYFWLTIPGGQDPKDYNTTIYIMEEME